MVSAASDSRAELQSFKINAHEKQAVDNLSETLFRYVLLKEASAPDKILVDVKKFCGMALSSILKAMCSNVVYYNRYTC